MKKAIHQKLESVSKAINQELIARLLPTTFLIALACFFAYKFIDPAPPRRIVIATGISSPNYNAFARIYQIYLQQEGIQLEIRNSTGDIENIQALKDPKSDVDFAFIQDGVAKSEGAGTLQSLGSLYYEPVWIMCRCNNRVSHLSHLKGKRIAIGAEGDGTKVLAQALLNASGINASNSKLVSIDGETAANQLIRQKIDAMIIVDSPESVLIKRVLSHDSIRLISLDDAEAYSRIYPYLHHLVLPEGAIDIGRNIPNRNVHLVAPSTTIVTKETTHPALIYLMMKIISQVHNTPTVFNTKGTFPSSHSSDFPLNTQAANFYKSGLPVLDKYLPFWISTFISRSIIVILPLLAIFIPLSKILPKLYDWMIRRKLIKYYGELRYLENLLKLNSPVQNKAFFLERLDEIEAKVKDLKIPITYSQDLYNLRSHIDLVRAALNK
jgi:TRAP transporter TAXI family solute receptor